MQNLSFVIKENLPFFPATAPPTQKRVGKIFTKKSSFFRQVDSQIKFSNKHLKTVFKLFFSKIRNVKNVLLDSNLSFDRSPFLIELELYYITIVLCYMGLSYNERK
ncbi:hypothetical protein CH380_02010 [Leptospira adleri]|uniref:Uncharacterized protein n=1 Tax=Leptospira adleri TaxID=2023186 RepID=A0A2M9YUX3_9LEPT|nr:hypothetical protein CH380_02010 [Leptospira adleri]PJZ62462.1 hypothetical protein CH376_08175 [Leptospira adleri]